MGNLAELMYDVQSALLEREAFFEYTNFTKTIQLTNLNNCNVYRLSEKLLLITQKISLDTEILIKEDEITVNNNSLLSLFTKYDSRFKIINHPDLNLDIKTINVIDYN